jgi:3-hydroxymyristoyl/3-hydroxydecanoyl-(acyl carrier protein) dehydratase
MLDISVASNHHEVVLPEDSAYFDGHFEHKKILPAVAQISLCMAHHKEEFAQGFTFASARFYKEIGPEKPIKISCDNSKKNRLVFELFDQSELCSKIVFSLAQQE